MRTRTTGTVMVMRMRMKMKTRTTKRNECACDVCVCGACGFGCGGSCGGGFARLAWHRRCCRCWRWDCWIRVILWWWWWCWRVLLLQRGSLRILLCPLCCLGIFLRRRIWEMLVPLGSLKESLAMLTEQLLLPCLSLSLLVFFFADGACFFLFFLFFSFLFFLSQIKKRRRRTIFK